MTQESRTKKIAQKLREIRELTKTKEGYHYVSLAVMESGAIMANADHVISTKERIIDDIFETVEERGRKV